MRRRRRYTGIEVGAYERLLAELEVSQMPALDAQQVGGPIHRFGSPPRDIILRCEPGVLHVLFERVEWHGSHTPKIVSSIWRSRPLVDLDEPRLRSFVTSARAARRRQYRICRYCQEFVGPGHMFSSDTCQGCASEHLGVVY